MTKREDLSKGIEKTIKLCRQQGFTDAEITREVLSYEAKNGLRVINLGDFPEGQGVIIFIPDEPLIEEVGNAKENTNETTQESNPRRP